MDRQYSPIIVTDQQRLVQVLLSLQANAIKFTKSGGIKSLVEIKEEGLDQYLKIQVNDTGIGIDPEQQTQLFGMFNLVNNTQQLNTNGIGLGLTVCSEIVKKFGGTINFTSEINIGSTFTFSFKLRGANEEEVLGVQRMNEKKMYFQWNNTTNVDGLKYLYNLNLDRNIHIPR